jgi:hypothetical protein
LCPQCGDVIVYNGNFFCNSFDAIEWDREARDIFLNPGTCDWALPHPMTRRKDREMADKLHAAGFMKVLDYG